MARVCARTRASTNLEEAGEALLLEDALQLLPLRKEGEGGGSVSGSE
jgi:hypothetical protein